MRRDTVSVFIGGDRGGAGDSWGCGEGSWGGGEVGGGGVETAGLWVGRALMGVAPLAGLGRGGNGRY